MGKEKTKGGVSNKHLNARISYLQQAATYLAVRAAHAEGARASTFDAAPAQDQTSILLLPVVGDVDSIIGHNELATSTNASIFGGRATREAGFALPQFCGLSRLLGNHLGQVARKAQVRLHTNIKHSFCRRCSTTLVPGKTCTKRTENLSRGGKKPHADVLVVECAACRAVKRFPVGAKRQKRRVERHRSHEATDGILPARIQGNEPGLQSQVNSMAH